MHDALAEEAEEAEEAQRTQARSGFKDSVRAAAESAAAHLELINDVDPGVVDPAAQAMHEQAQQPKSAAQPAPAAPEAAPAGGTGAASSVPTHCRFCHHDMRDDDIPEPSPEDKEAFLHTFLGELSYVKEYQLFDGSVRVTFRTLTLPESDVLHKTAQDELKNGKILTEADYWERVLRLRFQLELQRYTSPTFDHQFPDGLDPHTNPNAKTTWRQQLQKTDIGIQQLLIEVETHLMTTCLRREPIYRVLYNQATVFNRLARRLEVMVPNLPFWKKTEPPP